MTLPFLEGMTLPFLRFLLEGIDARSLGPADDAFLAELTSGGIKTDGTVTTCKKTQSQHRPTRAVCACVCACACAIN